MRYSIIKIYLCFYQIIIANYTIKIYYRSSMSDKVHVEWTATSFSIEMLLAGLLRKRVRYTLYYIWSVPSCHKHINFVIYLAHFQKMLVHM